MKRKRKRREYLLNRIIFSQVIIFCILVIILVGKKEPTDQKKEAQSTPSNVVDQASPSEIPTTATAGGVTTSIDSITVLPEDNYLTENTTPTEAITNPSDVSISPTVAVEDHASGVELPTQTVIDPTQSTVSSSVPAFAQGMSNDFIGLLANTQEGQLIQHTGVRDITYYAQTDARWAQKYYGGEDTIEEYGCGPTSMSIVISSMTNTQIDPVQMSAWAYEKGYWYKQSGSTHKLIPEASEAFGLKAEGVENTYEAEAKLRTALENGNMVVALMGGGSFTKSGHFIVFTGVNEEGLVYVADPNSEENTNKTWELSQLITDARSWAAAGGPFWIISQ